MSSNKEKIAVLVPKGADPVLDRVLLDIISEVESAVDYFEGKESHITVLSLLLVFFRAIRLKHEDKQQIANAFMEAIVVGFEQKLAAIGSVSETAQQIRDLSDRAFGAETALEERRSEIDRLQRFVTELQKQVETIPDLNNRVLDAERALREERGSNAGLLNKVSAAERQLSAIAELRNKATAAEAAVRPLQADNTRLKADIDSLMLQLRSVADQQSRFAGLQTKVATAETETARLRTELAAKTEEVANVRLRWSQEADQVEKLQGQIASLKDEAENKRLGLDGIVRPVLIIAAKEVDRLESAKNAFTSLHTSLVDAMNRLSDSIGQPSQPSEATQTVVLAETMVSVEAVVAEIQRREDWLRNLTEYTLEVEAEMHQQEELYQGQSEAPEPLIRLRKLHQILRTMETEARPKQDALLKYKRAVEGVAAGIPDGVMGVPLRRLPSVSDIPTVEDEAEEQEVAPQLPEPDSARIQQLKSLAEVYRVSPSGMLVVTLYDALPLDLQGKSKSVQVVVGRAMRIGIFASYGFTEAAEILDSWSNSNSRLIESLVASAGRVPGHILRQRTKRNLPWNVQQVLTPDEVKRFQKEVSDK